MNCIGMYNECPDKMRHSVVLPRKLWTGLRMTMARRMP
jgi:hypothetical protein